MSNRSSPSGNSHHQALHERYMSWPIPYRLISAKKNPCKCMATEKGIRPANIWGTAIALILQSAFLLGGIPIQNGPAIRVVLDAYFFKTPFLNSMIKKGIGIVFRLRNDAIDREGSSTLRQRTSP